MIKKLILLTLCLPVLAFGAAACGSDDDDSSSDGAATTSESTDSSSSSSEASQDIVQLAASNEDLSTLVDALTAADLVETLEGDGPFTVFAPTNEAFDALPPEELERLLKPANQDELANILTYHVVSGDVMASDLSDGQKIETVQGDKLTVKINGDKVMINDATVVQADVEASNGVVHVIDAVLIPQN
ncbi:MAG: fasciclin domain-containing protein [Thermoleophilia bacterium]|nr:fasciclin domain-containing protein [Thermoleophilia bacterium]